MRISELLTSDFLDFYHVAKGQISLVSQLVNREAFDLDDDQGGIAFVKEAGQGKLSFTGNHEQIEVVAYDDFFKQIKKPRAFVESHKHCDFLIVSDRSNTNFLLVEITSALGGTFNLRKPILNKKTGEVLFPGGKYEKVENQLADSLSTLMAVPSVNGEIAKYNRKICLMGYEIIQYDDPVKRITHPFQRYLAIEMAETNDNGAILHNAQIEAMGFEYRRISKDAVFSL